MIKEVYVFCDKCRSKYPSFGKYVYKLGKLFINLFYPITQRLNRKCGTDADGEYIVSLSSFPERIDKVWITIASIMNQSKKAKRILLWLAEDLFPNGENDLPQSLLSLKERGLEINFCEDIWPHKKYYFSMKNNPEDIIITIDDDVFYPENTLEKLWDTHLRFPKAIACICGHVVEYKKDGSFDKYNNWVNHKLNVTEPSLQLFPIGCGGVLYPPHLINEQLFNIQTIKDISLANDDVWLKTMETLNYVPAVQVFDKPYKYYDIIGTKRSGLFNKNVDEERNDRILNLVCERYPEFPTILFEDRRQINHGRILEE